MKKEDLYYMAGLVDGEGSVLFTKPHRNNLRCPQVSVTNTKIELLLPFKAHFGGNISSKRTYKKHHTASYHWKVTHQKALVCLKALLPALRHPDKIRKATLLLEEYPKIVKRNGKYSKSDLRAFKELEKDFFHPSTP